MRREKIPNVHEISFYEDVQLLTSVGDESIMKQFKKGEVYICEIKNKVVFQGNQWIEKADLLFDGYVVHARWDQFYLCEGKNES